LLSSLSSLFIVNCVSLFLTLERVTHDTCDLRVIYGIYDFLNCATFLNIFCTMLFHPYF
jgi:hypothetical protein